MSKLNLEPPFGSENGFGIRGGSRRCWPFRCPLFLRKPAQRLAMSHLQQVRWRPLRRRITLCWAMCMPLFAQRGVEIIVKDTQSSPARAAEVTQELIAEGVSMVLVASTPETTNPTASVCEANQIPCISTVAPWQPYFFGQGGNPETGFNYSYHFFWGLGGFDGCVCRHVESAGYQQESRRPVPQRWRWQCLGRGLPWLHGRARV